MNLGVSVSWGVLRFYLLRDSRRDFDGGFGSFRPDGQRSLRFPRPENQLAKCPCNSHSMYGIEWGPPHTEDEFYMYKTHLRSGRIPRSRETERHSAMTHTWTLSPDGCNRRRSWQDHFSARSRPTSGRSPPNGCNHRRSESRGEVTERFDAFLDRIASWVPSGRKSSPSWAYEGQTVSDPAVPGQRGPNGLSPGTAWPTRAKRSQTRQDEPRGQFDTLPCAWIIHEFTGGQRKASGPLRAEPSGSVGNSVRGEAAAVVTLRIGRRAPSAAQ